MSLAIGTALQNGDYVLDAFSFKDSLGPTYLATHIPTGQPVQIKVLGSHQPEQIPEPEVRSHYRHRLQQIAALNHPHIAPKLLSFEEDGVNYLVMSAALGAPLTHWVTPQQPCAPKTAMGLLKQVKSALEALRPLGWQGVLLSPDQIWQVSATAPVRLSGFGLPPAHQPQSPGATPNEAVMVRQLASLLYFLLVGQRPNATSAPLVHLHHQKPGLPSALEAALQAGLTTDVTPQNASLEAWWACLPTLTDQPAPPQPAATPTDTLPKTLVVSPPAKVEAAPQSQRLASTALVEAPADRAQSSGRRWFRARWALLLTAGLASFTGLSFGLSLRLTPASTSNPSRFDPDQAFPPREDWGGQDPVADFESPFVPNQDNFERPEPAVPQPTVPTPVPAVMETPTVDPVREPDLLPRSSEPATLEDDPLVPDNLANEVPEPGLAPAPMDSGLEAPAPVAPPVQPAPVPVEDLAPAPPAPLVPNIPTAPAPAPMTPPNMGDSLVNPANNRPEARSNLAEPAL